MIQVKKSIGLHTIQDKGRVGYQSFGVPVSGPMDEVAFIIANYLVLNEDSSSVIELSSGSLSLLFSSESVVAATGFAIVRVNGIGVPLWRPIYVSSGDVLDIQLNLSGNFAYLSIAGGWKSELWLGSTATYLPLGVGKLIKQGAILTQLKGIDKRVDIFAKYLKSKGKKYDNWGVSTNSIPPYSSESIQLMRGMEINSFTKESLVLFTERKYKVAHEKNRMAYVIEDAMLESVDSKEWASMAVQKGTIQVTPNATLYILMSDSQTIGGYPRVGQVARVDWPILAQMSKNKEFSFRWIKVEEAIEQLRKREEELYQLKLTLEHKFLTYSQYE